VRLFILRYAAGAVPPRGLPSVRGLLQARREPGELRLTIAGVDETTRETLRDFGAASIEETPVGFNDALIGYLGDRPSCQDSFLQDIAAVEMAGGAL
jgi:hypothetical protein